MHSVIHKVATCFAAMHREFISFPRDPAEIRQVKNGFYNIQGFPNVVGAIDCTHIRLKFSIGGDEAIRFINRHHYYSINTQAICDSQLRIRNVISRWPGSVHDSRIWDNCLLHGEFEREEIQGWLIGDAGYACQPFLMTPLLNPLTNPEMRYNRSHIKTGSTIEQTFGIWKCRFPGLGTGLRVKLQKAPTIVVAAAVLHNICITNGEEIFEGDDVDNNMPPDEIHDNQDRGNVVRTRLIANVFT